MQGYSSMGRNYRADLATVPGHLLFFVRGTMVVQIGHQIQPHDVEPIGHDIQLEHGHGAQPQRAACQHSQHALQEPVAGVHLQAGMQEAMEAASQMQEAKTCTCAAHQHLHLPVHLHRQTDRTHVTAATPYCSQPGMQAQQT